MNKCYALAFDKKAKAAELTMYGEIVETIPFDWWTEKKVDGDFIVQADIISALEEINANGAKSLTIRMNSIGGDAGVSILIHNRLRELADAGVDITCIVDGVAMSGGSLIMCACDKVRVNPSSLVMIHKAWTLLIGAYNADEVRDMARSLDAWDKAQASIYTRKSGLSDTVVNHMMSDTTYMTGKEAVEKGFADELIEDAAPLDIAASASRTSLFVSGREFHLAPGMKAPDSIPTVTTAQADVIKQSAETDEKKGEVISMATNLEELRTENAELAAQVESDLRAIIAQENTETVQTAVANERQRLADIDEIAGLYDTALVREAKYGDHPCTAQEMAFTAAKNAAKTGTGFMAAVMKDAKESGVNEVQTAQAPEDGKNAEADVAEAGKADAKKYRDIKEGSKR
ncbi:MAG: Clp protease ClpP [Clostridia bacterium]|nr:Clp protease ClpP [Clostridia bacterium]